MIPSEMTFEHLHMAIQVAMGWQDYHLYSFENADTNVKIVCDEESYDDWKAGCREYKKQLKRGEPDEYMKKIAKMKVRKAQNTIIDEYLKDGISFGYTYDFGDSWDHLVTFEVVDEDWRVGFPVVVEGKGSCPPEDSGGPGGYERFLSILKDKKDPDNKMIKEWGDSQLYRPFSRKATNYTMFHVFKLITGLDG